jgi:uncharacterized membrane protein
LFACVAGVVALVVAVRRRAQLESVVLTLVIAGLTAAAAAPFQGVT